MDKPPLLKRGVVPNTFKSYPEHLQPPAEKRRRVLLRNIPPSFENLSTQTQHQSLESSTAPDMRTTSHNILPEEPLPSTSSYIPVTLPQTPKGSTSPSPQTTPRKQMGRPKVSPSTRIPKLKQQVNTLQKKVKRLERKLEIQKNLLDILQQENQLQSAKLGSIDGCLSELVENQAKNVCRKTKKVYTDNIKEFAMTMHYYSPKAYEYLRSKLELPTSRTIQRWLESVECEPGFLTDILKLVNERNGEIFIALLLIACPYEKDSMLTKLILKLKVM